MSTLVKKKLDLVSQAPEMNKSPSKVVIVTQFDKAPNSGTMLQSKSDTFTDYSPLILS